MKKFLFSALFTFSMLNAQTSIFGEDFEQITDLQSAGWTLYNDANTPYGTYEALFPNAWNIVSWGNESGNKVASCPSWFTEIKPADRWIVSPAIILPTNSKVSLEFFARSHQDSPYDDGFKLKISTSNTAKSSFTNVLAVDHAPNSTIVAITSPYTVNLSAYAGQTIYLAWVNDYTNGNLLSIDDITVTATSLMAVDDVRKNNMTVYPNPASEYFIINNANDVISADIYDVSGKVVKSKLVAVDNRFDISDLANGVYTVAVETKTGIVSKKLIKK